MRGNPPAAVNNRAYCRGKLNGRNLKRLSKGNRGKLHFPYIFFFVHNGCRFSGKVYPRFFHQAKLLKVAVIIIHTKTQSHLNKHRVAGIHRTLHKIFRTVSCSFMAMNTSVLHHLKAWAGKSVIRMHNSLRKPCCHGDDFESRTGLISIINRQISPHLITGVLLFLFCHSGSVCI